MISQNAIDMIKMIVYRHGTDVTLYNPTYIPNEEGDIDDVDLGTGTTVKAVMFELTPEEMQWRTEGIDTRHSYRCYMIGDTNIDKESIIKYDGLYYKIHSIAKAIESGNTVYIDCVITLSELNM